MVVVNRVILAILQESEARTALPPPIISNLSRESL